MDDRTKSQPFQADQFEKVDPSRYVEETSAASGSDNRVDTTISAIDNLMGSFRKDKPFALSLVAIVGYIVIAALSNISSWQDFLRYLLIIGIVSSVYKFNRKEIRFNIELSNRLLISVIIVLTIGIVIQNWTPIYDFSESVLNALNDKPD